MKKSTIWLLTVTMVITFVGLLFAQFIYLDNIIKMRNEQFKEAVQRSLYLVSTHLEEDETERFLTETIEDELYGSNKNRNSGIHYGHPAMKNSQYSIASPYSVVTFTYNGVSQSAVMTYDVYGIEPDDSFTPVLDTYNNVQDALANKNHYHYKRGILDEVTIRILEEASSRPILERVDTLMLEDYLEMELENNGLELPFEFALVDSRGEVVFKSDDYNPSNSDDALFSQIVFPNDPPGLRNTLRVYFPSQKDYIFDAVRFIIPSFIFTFILLLTFTFTIITIFRQKKLTDMKNDFINNMTHEFKTPVSTISLAGQMLNDPVMSKNPAMLKHISGVINDETKRLRLQVEKVLQMSMFDRQKAQLKLHDVDVNDLIAGVMSTFKIKVEKFGGTIDADLVADDVIVAVDEMHFTNVIFNLLDNAVKYRREEVPLNLFIRTRILGSDKVEIAIQDNGIGIKKDDLKKIFDKFYRVSTGNRHDVKGFGLGLAYVYKIIKDHKGEIRAESDLNEGSTFIITLPLIKS